MAKRVERWEAEDGTVHASQEEAERYESRRNAFSAIYARLMNEVDELGTEECRAVADWIVGNWAWLYTVVMK